MQADLTGQNVPVDVPRYERFCLSSAGHRHQVVVAAPARVLILRGAGHAAAAGRAVVVASAGVTRR